MQVAQLHTAGDMLVEYPRARFPATHHQYISFYGERRDTKHLQPAEAPKGQRKRTLFVPS